MAQPMGSGLVLQQERPPAHDCAAVVLHVDLVLASDVAIQDLTPRVCVRWGHWRWGQVLHADAADGVTADGVRSCNATCPRAWGRAWGIRCCNTRPDPQGCVPPGLCCIATCPRAWGRAWGIRCCNTRPDPQGCVTPRARCCNTRPDPQGVGRGAQGGPGASDVAIQDLTPRACAPRVLDPQGADPQGALSPCLVAPVRPHRGSAPRARRP